MTEPQQTDEPDKSLNLGIEDIDIEDIEALPVPSGGSELARAEKEAEIEANELYPDPQLRLRAAEAAKQEESVEVLKQDRQERQKYAKKLFYLISMWLIGVYSLIFFSGFSKTQIHFDTKGIPVVEKVTIIPKFELSDTVLLAMIGGTTINVLGLFVIVANYLFNSPKSGKKEEIEEKNKQE